MAERERLETDRDERYVRPDAEGQFDDVEDVGRSSAQDQKRDAETTTRAGQGEQGERETGGDDAGKR